MIVGGDGKVLPSEFFDSLGSGGQPRTGLPAPSPLIIEQNQVQIYEELTKDAKGRFTTSFLHRAPDVHQTAVIPEKRCG